MKKITCWFTVVMMSLGVLTACNNDKSPSGGEAETAALSGSIVLATTRSDRVKEIQALVEEFTALNPGTNVEVQVIGDLEQEMRVLMSARELPDISPVIDAVKVSDLSDFYEPLDDLGFTGKNLYFYSSGLGTDGKLYTVSSGVSYDGVIYNKNVFKDAGITAPPTTKEEFFAACEKIKAIGVVPVASNFKDVWPLRSFAMQSGILVKNDGGYINSFAEKDFILEEDGALIGMDFVADLKDKGYLEPDLMSTNIESFKTDLATGRVAMAFLADWLPPQIVTAGAAAEDLGMMPAPYAKCILMDKDFSYAVSNNSKHKPLAKAFLQWLWEDGRYAKATALDTPRVGGDTPDAPWLEDLFSFGLPVVENQPLSDAYKDVVAKAQYDFDWIMVQEYLLTSNRDAFVEATNRRWAEARK